MKKKIDLQDLTIENIRFKSRSLNDMKNGYGNPKISFQIDGYQPKWKALYRGDCFMGGLLQNKIAEFLQSNEIKDFILNHFKNRNLYDKANDEMIVKYRNRCEELFHEEEPYPDFDERWVDDKKMKVHDDWHERMVKQHDIAEKEICGEDGMFGWRKNLRIKIGLE